MKRVFVVLLVVLFSGTLEGLRCAEGSISGRIVITKILTKKRIVMPTYDMRGATVTPQNPQQSAKRSDASIDELSRVVVYLEGKDLQPGNPTKVTLTQKNREFVPEFVVIPVGSTVEFPNADPIFHNIFSLSKVKQFDLGYYPKGDSRSVKFDRPGIVQVFCHIHADMSATILVLANRFWTRPDDQGVFALTGVPPGTYELVAWHRSAGLFRRRISLKDGEKASVEIVIPVKEADAGTEGDTR